MAGGVCGGEGAALAQDMGDGDVPQAAPRGPEVRSLPGIHREHQRSDLMAARRQYSSTESMDVPLQPRHEYLQG
jgi:hypothetical protein